MARRPRITITMSKETKEALERHAWNEGRTRGETAGILFRAVLRGLDRQRKPEIHRFAHALEGTGGERIEERQLDPAELRTKSREAVRRLQGAVSTVAGLGQALEALLEDEAATARAAKIRRLRLAPQAEVRS